MFTNDSTSNNGCLVALAQRKKGIVSVAWSCFRQEIERRKRWLSGQDIYTESY